MSVFEFAEEELPVFSEGGLRTSNAGPAAGHAIGGPTVPAANRAISHGDFAPTAKFLETARKTKASGFHFQPIQRTL